MAKREPLSALVPTNWLDPLLTGPSAVVKPSRTSLFTCRDIENLLNAVRARVAAAEMKHGRTQSASTQK